VLQAEPTVRANLRKIIDSLTLHIENQRKILMFLTDLPGT